MIELRADSFPSLEGILPFDVTAYAYPVGSRHILTPPVMDTDEDYLIYSPFNLDIFLQDAGFEDESGNKDSKYGTSNRFTSWRRGDLNLIVTNEQKFANDYQVATLICAKFNVADKDDRIKIYQAIVDSSPEALHEYDIDPNFSLL